VGPKAALTAHIRRSYSPTAAPKQALMKQYLFVRVRKKDTDILAANDEQAIQKARELLGIGRTCGPDRFMQAGGIAVLRMPGRIPIYPRTH
jgi:hypothetical protein